MDGDVIVTSDPKAQTFDVISLLKERLPDYIVQCFLASGYDEPTVIADMDVTDNPGNSITDIETYMGTSLLMISNTIIMDIFHCHLNFHQVIENASANLYVR